MLVIGPYSNETGVCARLLGIIRVFSRTSFAISICPAGFGNSTARCIRGRAGSSFSLVIIYNNSNALGRIVRNVVGSRDGVPVKCVPSNALGR